MTNGSDLPSPSSGSPPPIDLPSLLWTPSRKRLLGWFKEKAPSLAELYETAVVFLEGQRFPGRTRIISHCVREIANALPSILDGVERKRLEYDKCLDKIVLAWEQTGESGGLPSIGLGEATKSHPQYALSQDLIIQIEVLIKEHKLSRSKTERIAERLFRANRPENRHFDDVLRPVLKQWLKLKDWFVGHAHDSGKTDAEYDWDDFKTRFKLFEQTVSTLGQGFFQTIDDLDELIRISTPADVKSVLSQLGHFEHYRYFFDHINDPTWISALQAEGIFKSPPASENGNSPRWPASECLVRMAGNANLQVLVDALTDIADALRRQPFPNSSVIRDLVEVLLKLPPQESAQFVSSLNQWIYHENGFMFWRRLGRLVNHLARGGKTAEALALFARLVAVERVRDRGDTEYLYKLVKPRIGMYDYREIIKEHLQHLQEVSGRDLFEVLFNGLQSAAKLSRHSSTSEEWDDNSSAWQPDLHVLDDEDDVRSLLAVRTRDTAEFLLMNGRIEIAPLVERLEQGRWLIFRRLALHFLSSTTNSPRDIIAARLTDKRLFRDRNLWNEYDALIQVGFARLTEDEQKTILSWVEAGPENLAERIRNYEITIGKPSTRADIERYCRNWQWRRLWSCHTALPSAWRERYAALLEEFGELESLPRMREARDIAIGERAPRTEDELRTLSAAELREYLLMWVPARTSFPYPNRSGLAQVLTLLVKANPTLYADGSERWRELDPTYLHGIIRGFVEALQANRPLLWVHVLGLCSWVLDQPRAIAGRNVDSYDDDTDWGGTRWWIVELLRTGFQHNGLEISIEHRGDVWRLLEALTMDSDPEPDEDAEYVERPSQSMDRATHSVRGRAIEGLFFYPGWLKRQAGDSGPERFPSEAMTVLERHLDLERDPSLPIRSLYGRWVPWILQFAPIWGRAAISKIFLETEERYWLVAWDGFIRFNNP